MAAIDALIDELYGLHPTEFTRARNDAAKDSPDRAAIMALAKPTPAAWVVNLLVRQRNKEITGVLELGEQLRSAQDDLDRDALTELTKQRRQLVGALAKQGADLAELQGHKVSASAIEEVAQTLQAAMADADAAAAVHSGHLLRPLTTVGLTVDLEGAVAGNTAPLKKSATVVDELEERRAEKRRQQAEAKRALEAAETAQQKAERRVADALRHRDSVADDYEAAQAHAKELKRSLADAERDLKAVAAERDAAADAADAARALVER